MKIGKLSPKKMTHVSSSIELDGFMSDLVNLGKNVERAALRAITKAAELVKHRSVSNSPVDTGDLESCHVITTSKRDGKIVAEIWIDDSKISHADKHDIPTSRYAVIMHECLAPYGSGLFNLGPLSEVKRARGNDVGGKFLERAMSSSEDEINEIVAAEFIRAIKGKK